MSKHMQTAEMEPVRGQIRIEAEQSIIAARKRQDRALAAAVDVLVRHYTDALPEVFTIDNVIAVLPRYVEDEDDLIAGLMLCEAGGLLRCLIGGDEAITFQFLKPRRVAGSVLAAQVDSGRKVDSRTALEAAQGAFLAQDELGDAPPYIIDPALRAVVVADWADFAESQMERA